MKNIRSLMVFGTCLALSSLALAGAAHAKTTVCPGPTIIDGIDVSYWQGTIDWAQVKTVKKYAIMRAAHALKADTKFDANWKACHAQGLRCGVYQFFEPGIDPIAQADLMLGMMGKLQPGDLPPVIDVESKIDATPAQLAAAVGKWIAHVEKASGRKPMIYSGGYFWEDNVKSSAFLGNPLWHPQYCTNCCPNVANPWKTWFFWQHSSTGSVAGIKGNVDLDRWNGTLAELEKFSGLATCNVACEGNTMVKADCSKQACPATSACKVVSGKASCQAVTCAIHCEGTKLIDAGCKPSDCATLPGLAAGTCMADGLGAHCVSKFCPATGETTVCLPGATAVGACLAGKINQMPCPAGTACVPGAQPAKCLAPQAADAGVTDSGPIDAGGTDAGDADQADVGAGPADTGSDGQDVAAAKDVTIAAADSGAPASEVAGAETLGADGQIEPGEDGGDDSGRGLRDPTDGQAALAPGNQFPPAAAGGCSTGPVGAPWSAGWLVAAAWAIVRRRARARSA